MKIKFLFRKKISEILSATDYGKLISAENITANANHTITPYKHVSHFFKFPIWYNIETSIEDGSCHMNFVDFI